MEWFVNTFLKSFLNNPKAKDITVPERECERKTLCISEKQYQICCKYMRHVDNANYYSFYRATQHLEFAAHGYNFRVDQQPKGYAIMVFWK